MLGGVGVAGADVLVLERFELLLGAEFVGLGCVSCRVRVRRSAGVEGLTIGDCAVLLPSQEGRSVCS